MPTTVKTTVTVEVTGASSARATHTQAVEGFEHIQVTVPASDSVTAEVHAGTADRLLLLLVKASAYPLDSGASPPSPQLTYDIDGDGARDLTAPLFLSGAVGDVLGAVNSVVFANASSEAVVVDIYVGRDATP